MTFLRKYKKIYHPLDSAGKKHDDLPFYVRLDEPQGKWTDIKILDVVKVKGVTGLG